ncbi:MAG TPA: hypothetical protein VNW52_04685 [Burkholderiaceae bacterium]|jgi:hypothetical protein|nr:hypothetical protein [Burkholderiaceae bacterium]
MNFALLVSNLPDLYQVPHTMPAPIVAGSIAPSIFRQMFSRLFAWGSA